MTEGSKVVYIGEDTMVGINTIGKVLASAGSSQHVQWVEGLRAGQIDLVPNEDVLPLRVAHEEGISANRQFEDSLDTPSMMTVAVRDTYDDFGEDGLLNALSDSGHLATLTEYAGEAIGLVASRLRQDPSFSLVLDELDDHEAESLLVRVSVSLLQGEGED